MFDKVNGDMTVMVQNMMLQVTKSFTDYLTTTLTPHQPITLRKETIY